MRKFLLSIIIFLLVFYQIYPQGISFFGYSFVFTSGVLGLGLYLYNHSPFPEVIKIALAYLPFLLYSFLSTYLNDNIDSYVIAYSRSTIAWFFSAYLIINVYYKAYPKGSLTILLYFIVAAVLAQCIITVAMFLDPAINEFFSSLQKMDETARIKRDMTEGKRLLGYGTAFFGAGVICGYTLILLIYLIMEKKMSILKTALFALIYCAIFYIGLLTARTTLVGAVASLVLAIVLIFDKKSNKTQLLSVFGFSVILLTIGYTLTYLYFPEFADWAFEVFINYQETGELRTSSSDGLTTMFFLPRNSHEWLMGIGTLDFWGNDVGYTRLLIGVGLPGTLAFFYFHVLLTKMSFTNNKMFNATLLILFAYNMALNVKGLSDLNPLLFIFFFYFLHYRYYIFTPYLYRIGRIKQNTLRATVQAEKTRRRIQGNVRVR